jgi:type VI secretion system secreted protein VgrG
MNAKPTQDTRIAELTTSLGKDRLVLVRFEATEGLSELFDMRIDCASEQPVADLAPLIGKEASVRVFTIGGKTRHFSGIVVEAGLSGSEHHLFGYRLTLRPWTWLLSHAADSRIFQNKTVKEIIQEVFDKAGFGGQYDVSGLVENYKPLEYCVQYRETHLDFVLRLMEQFGIYYWFKHEPGKHTLMLADSSSVHQPIADLDKVDLIPMGESTRDDKEHLSAWNFERSFQTGKVTVTGYDFATPDFNMKHEETLSGGYARDDNEVFVYPHKYKSPDKNDLGEKFAKATLQSRQARDRRRYAEGNAPSLYPGGCVTLQKSRMGENGQYLVVAARHSLVTQMYRSGGGHAGEAYSGHYVFQPKDRQFRAPQITPRPIVHGPQTALVVGPAGEEIHTDKYGRVKLQFHWDRQGRKDDKSSRWVRVAHTWSGKEWGSVYIPRIGMEAVVEFIEGDPDRPIVVGTVYNANNMPPWALPANKTQRGLKTRSSKGGSGDNYNELMFEDKKGSELVRFHAEKDLNSTIEDTETRTIKGKNRSGPGDAARKTKIEKGDDKLDIENGDRKIKISRHRTEEIGQNETVDVGVNQTITVGNEIMIEAGAKITIKCGASKITMTPASIKIETVNLEATAVMTKVEGKAILDEKGGLILLNS